MISLILSIYKDLITLSSIMKNWWQKIVYMIFHSQSKWKLIRFKYKNPSGSSYCVKKSLEIEFIKNGLFNAYLEKRAIIIRHFDSKNFCLDPLRLKTCSKTRKRKLDQVSPKLIQILFFGQSYCKKILD